jgi:hypothetical protein
MKYFFDTEFIEGFHTNGPSHPRKRHHVDLISIGIVAEDGREYHAISSEYDSNEADPWVIENVIKPLYLKTVSDDARDRIFYYDFHLHYGKSLSTIKRDILDFFGYGMVSCPAGESPWAQIHDKDISVYAYFADYDWVVLCSIFGRMIDLPKGMPMYCRDLKQMMEERGLTKEWKQEKFPTEDNSHDALLDARFNKALYEEVIKHKIQ